MQLCTEGESLETGIYDEDTDYPFNSIAIQTLVTKFTIIAICLWEDMRQHDQEREWDKQLLCLGAIGFAWKDCDLYCDVGWEGTRPLGF